MISTAWLGILLALASAAAWGGGDFSGGVATRRSGQFQVLALAALSGLALVLVFVFVLRERLPGPVDALWAAGAGLGGALGIAALYKALSLGNAASVAPTAAVVSAALPVIFSALTAGWPSGTQMLGFVVAAGGLWLVSQAVPTTGTAPRQGLGLAVVGGLGFGAFYILIGQVQSGLVFTPLLIARGIALLAALLLLRAQGLALPGLGSNPVALLAGVLDAGGNILYVMARQYTRLDVAAVLASLYPAATVVLAAVLLKERVQRSQWAGAGLCLVAVALIAL